MFRNSIRRLPVGILFREKLTTNFFLMLLPLCDQVVDMSFFLGA